ncbi:MAG: ABC transporter ATP-binding protein [Bacteroidota bacterium]
MYKTHQPRSTSSVRSVIRMLMPFKGYLIALVGILLLYSSNLFFKTQLIKKIVDKSVQVASTHETWYLLIGSFGVVLLIEFFTFRFQEWYTLKYEPVLQNHITTSVLKYVFQREYGFFQIHFSGNLTSKINDLAVCIPALLAIVLYDYLVNFLLIGVAFLSLYQVSYRIAWAILCWALLTVITAMRFTSRSLQLAKKAAETTSNLVGKITDTFDNILSVRLFLGKNHAINSLKPIQEKYLETNQQYRWWMLKFYTLQGFSFQVYQISCLLFLIRLHSQHHISAGTFAMIFSINLIITDSLWKMFERMQELNTLWAKIKQALEVLLPPSRIRDNPTATSLVVNAGMICLQDVTFGYHPTTKVIKNQTLRIEAQQKIGLVGQSGSGKTTFINLIARLYDVDRGAILIDGQDIRSVTQETLYKHITLVSQESILFHDTILENIRCGNPEATDDEVIEASKQACSHEFIMHLPQQYATVVESRGLGISGGQRQRITIARALLKKAPIVLLDEITAHLDGTTSRKLNASLSDYLRESTVLTISHDLETLKQMDRILVFDKGNIVEDGTHSQLMAQDAHYTAFWADMKSDKRC